MKKILILIIFVLIVSFLKSQNYNNIVNHYFNGTPVYGTKIKTNIPFINSSFMPMIKIEGYNYQQPSKGPSIMNINIAFYILHDKFGNITMSTSGGDAPDTWLSVEDGKIVIFIDHKVYYGRFTISAYAKGMSGEKPEVFEGWTVVDEPLSGSQQTLIPYKNDFKTITSEYLTTRGITANKITVSKLTVDTLQLKSTNYFRLGKIGDAGNVNVPLGGVTTQYNFDFSGYRDVAKDQIGARISALRFNRHIDNKAYVQKTGLAFYTNPLGNNPGVQDLVERMRITPEGNVGIGIINPTAKLEVNGDFQAHSNISVGIDNQKEEGEGSRLYFKGTSSNTDPIWMSKYIRRLDQTDLRINIGDDHNGDRFVIGVIQPDNIWDEVFTVSTSGVGRVGIGISFPSCELDVNGKIKSNDIGTKVLNADSIFIKGKNILELFEQSGTSKFNSLYIGERQITPTQKLYVDGDIYGTKLDINGMIRGKELKLEATGWADFVFAPSYKLMPLSKVESHIREHKHLPDIPSEKEILENGVNVVEIQAKLLQKIEELTLYTIQQQKQLEDQAIQLRQLQEQLNKK